MEKIDPWEGFHPAEMQMALTGQLGQQVDHQTEVKKALGADHRTAGGMKLGVRSCW
ncbi:hypothetical protein GCM10010298_76930 [Streptomyces microflavus]|uniref:Uncharacterized protein n=3 Tax=Actinomycetes TaxID=1760 RepID=A0A918LJR5_9PSEU|nr:hypothetical protein GCM10010171_65360 [Actinokineospora fastidiosa]GGY00592.1 hypothetical protein GCM10010298_76930 [Streptomyces microflavus]GGZ31510.1 hypothetical protein GCM10010300_87050 [Streptomyces olivaceoviridis]GHB11909.1 hypothetical protein GCM10010305_63140 [Streptomyces termitum]GHB93017.1 hypothetical protein GCM10010306_104990 [Streptomyces umbrinus]